MRRQVVRGSCGIATVAFLLAVAFFSPGGHSEAQEGGPRLSPVRVESVVQREVRPYVRLIGTSRAFRKSRVAFEVEGRVVAFDARRGGAVDRGGILARIDSTDIALQLQQAKAEVREAEAHFENAALELQRNRLLYQKKSVSSREYDDARFRAGALENRIAALKARIGTIENDLSRCRVRAPFAGFVVQEHSEVGQWAKKGGAVADIVDIDPILVRVPVPDRYVGFVKPGQEIDLRFQGLVAKGARKGFVRNVVPEGNEEARTFPVEITVPNPDGALLAGFSCEVRLPVGTLEPRILVPKDAVVPGGGTYHVYVIQDGKAQRVTVEKGLAYEGRLAVKGDLAPGDMVVVEGNERLRPGEGVRILEDGAAQR